MVDIRRILTLATSKWPVPCFKRNAKENSIDCIFIWFSQGWNSLQLLRRRMGSAAVPTYFGRDQSTVLADHIALICMVNLPVTFRRLAHWSLYRPISTSKLSVRQISKTIPQMRCQSPKRKAIILPTPMLCTRIMN